MSTDDTEPTYTFVGPPMTVAEFAQGMLNLYKAKKELYGEWLAETEEEQKLRILGEQYHQRCEAYDRQVCSGTSPRTGEAIPLTVDQLQSVNRHALEVRKDIIREGAEQGFTEAQVIQAIRAYVR